MSQVYEKLLKCYECYKERIDFTPKVALVLGSGLGDFPRRYAWWTRSTIMILRDFRFPLCRDAPEDLFSAMSAKFGCLYAGQSALLRGI